MTSTFQGVRSSESQRHCALTNFLSIVPRRVRDLVSDWHAQPRPRPLVEIFLLPRGQPRPAQLLRAILVIPFLVALEAVEGQHTKGDGGFARPVEWKLGKTPCGPLQAVFRRLSR